MVSGVGLYQGEGILYDLVTETLQMHMRARRIVEQQSIV